MHPAWAVFLGAIVAAAILVAVLRRIDRRLPPPQDADYDEAAVDPPSFEREALTGPDGTRSDVRPVLGKPWPHLRDGRGEESR